MLDADEYLHLAIHATQHQQHHAALDYLHKALALNPGNAKAIFLLAAEHAELGLINRAITGMVKALELEPDLDFARYQLGLLYMQTNNIQASQHAWNYLRQHSSDATIKLVAQGLCVIDEDRTQGMLLIEQAANNETTNQFLKSSIEQIRDNLARNDTLDNTPRTNPDDHKVSHALFLNAYKNSTFNQDDES